MTQRKDKSIPVRPKPAPPGGRETGTAFDAWLQRGLHALFDDVTREPIPAELLRLIENDRRKPKSNREDTKKSEPAEQTQNATRSAAQGRKR